MINKNKILVFVAFLAQTVLFSQGAYYTIDRGKVKGDFELTLSAQNVKLSHTDFFSLKALNLQANRPNTNDLNSAGYKRKDLISYEITIERNSDHKKFYGRIAFYSMFNKTSITNQAVASYYNLEIGQGLFSQTSDGITTCVYEYYSKRPGDLIKYPTWVIWFSDVPLQEVIPRSTKDDVMYKGRNNLSLGIGFVNINSILFHRPINQGIDPNSIAEVKEIQPLFLKYEIAVAPKFTIGLNFSQHKMSANYNFKYDYDSSYTFKTATESMNYKAYSVSIKTNWHFAVSKHFQMFIGQGIGYNVRTVASTTTAKLANGSYRFFRPVGSYLSTPYQELKQRNIMVDLSLGARIFITKNIGLFIEAAAVKAAVQTGLVIGF